MFIGEKLDKESLRNRLDMCLLTSPEMKKWEGIMRSGKPAEQIQAKLDKTFEGKKPAG